jgi:hypothetical protein
MSMTSTELRNRSVPSPYNSPYSNDEEQEDLKDHPPPAKEVGKGMLIGMALAAVVIIGFIYYIEEEKWSPDWDMHAKVVAHHKRQADSHAHLSGLLKETMEKHERGELPVHEPTPEELEAQRFHEAMEEAEHDHLDSDPEAPGMYNALGDQMHDNKYELQHRLEEFWELDLNKDAFLSDVDFSHKPRRPSHLVAEAFEKLDTNKDGAVSIREFNAGFHDQSHIKEPWYHHKYGYVYGHEIPDHFKDAKVGAVKKGTEEHRAMKMGVHPAQTQRKIDDKKKDEEHKRLNEEAHKAEEAEHERQEKTHHDEHHDEEHH